MALEGHAAANAVAAMTPEERDRLGQASIERAQQNYNWETVVDRYEELFRQLVR